jgi:hypothetical protein
MEVALHVAISTITFLIDKAHSEKCNKNAFWASVVKYCHHLFSAYIWLGAIIYREYVVHALFCTLTLVHWIFIDECTFTTVHNKICGIEKDRFKDILSFISFKIGATQSAFTDDSSKCSNCDLSNEGAFKKVPHADTLKYVIIFLAISYDFTKITKLPFQI